MIKPWTFGLKRRRGKILTTAFFSLENILQKKKLNGNHNSGTILKN